MKEMGSFIDFDEIIYLMCLYKMNKSGRKKRVALSCESKY